MIPNTRNHKYTNMKIQRIMTIIQYSQLIDPVFSIRQDICTFYVTQCDIWVISMKGTILPYFEYVIYIFRESRHN